MTFTANTNPSSVMLEGHPEVEILAIRRRPAGYGGGIYVYVPAQSFLPRVNLGSALSREHPHSMTYNEAYDDEGNPTSRDWPRLVLRDAFDPHGPLIALNKSTGESFRYKLVGIFKPADGSEDVIHVVREGRPNSDALKILASTGKVISGGLGSALTFANAVPEPTTEDVILKSGETVRLTINFDRTIKAEYL